MMPVPDAVAAQAERLVGAAELAGPPLCLAMGRHVLRLRSNSPALLDTLGAYFAHCRLASDAAAEIEVLAIEREAPELEVGFDDWSREPGKRGRKDSYHDLPGGRLVRKVRTGMVFLQSPRLRIAAGPCLANANQVVNFIISQYMNALQQADWRICHAAALVRGGRALAIAGLSGGGKSTTLLQALEHPQTAFLSNDRLFLKRRDGEVLSAGVPKMPRINPGTLLHNARLERLLPESRQAELRALPPQALWDLEDKHDVPIEALYGAGRIATEAPLAAFVVLNWKRGGATPLQFERADLSQRRDLLAAIMKSPGPFYQHADGRFQADGDALDEAAYLAVLAGVPVYEVRGGIDFRRLVEHHLHPLLEHTA